MPIALPLPKRGDFCDMSNPDRPNPAGHADRSARKRWASPAIRDQNVKSLAQGYDPTDDRKPWARPEIRDQSVKSLTQSKPNQWPSEASPGTGS